MECEGGEEHVDNTAEVQRGDRAPCKGLCYTPGVTIQTWTPTPQSCTICPTVTLVQREPEVENA